MKKKLFTLIIILTFGQAPSITAEVICNGNICSNFPSIIQDFNSLVNSFEEDYLSKIAENNTNALFLLHTTSNGIGSGWLPRFQVGVGISVATVQKKDLTLEYENIKLEKLPNVGFGISPSLQLGVNLGWLFSRPYHSFWNQFTLYIHGAKVSFSEGDLAAIQKLDPKIQLRTKTETIGGMLRWQALQAKSLFSFFLIWNGVNIGAGYHQSEWNVDLVYLQPKQQKVNWNEWEARWGGDYHFQYHTQGRTYHTDIRTGLGILRIFQIIVGAGLSWNSGETNIRAKKEGPFVVKTGSVAVWEIPREFQSLIPIDTLEEGGNLGIQVEGKANSKKRLGYALAGLEFYLLGFSLILEGSFASKEIGALSLSLKYSF